MFENSDSIPLFWAAAYGHLDIVRDLIFARANVDEETCFGTPLDASATCGHLEVVRFLLGVSTDIHNNWIANYFQ